MLGTHNPSRASLGVILATAVLVGGCAWDGPSRDVRVVGAESERSDRGEVNAAGAEPAAAEVASSGTDRAPNGLEERPGAWGVVSVPATVAVVGDSLTVAATDEIETSLARIGVRATVIDGRESRRMASGSSGLPSGVSAIAGILADHEPDLWVVALGTNDVGAAVGVERFRADLLETLAAIPVDAPLVWVDVWIRDRHADVVRSNEVLHHELGRRRAPTRVVDWYSSGSVDGVITRDGVHLTTLGQARFAAAIADGIVELSTG